MIVRVGGSPPCSIHGWVKALNWCVITLGLMVIVMHGTWIVKKKKLSFKYKVMRGTWIVRQKKKASIQIRLNGDGNA